MRVGGAFKKQGKFPAGDSRLLTPALELLEHRIAEKFDALDRLEGDIVGVWKDHPGGCLAASGTTLGNGRLKARYRIFGGVNAQLRVFLEVGSTTTIGAFGFGFIAPPLYEFNPDAFPFITGNDFYAVPAQYAGVIAGAFRGGVLPALVTAAKESVVLGAALSAFVAGDVATIDAELPIRKAAG